MKKIQASTKERKTCRISGEKLIPLFSLGELFVSDFIADGVSPQQKKVELQFCLAPKSGLVQLAHSAPVDDMYRNYWYRSGTNTAMKGELRQIAESAQALVRHERGDLFVDIGCNDGTLLSFVDTTMVRVGFDPAKNNFKEASKKYANLIINDYFTAASFLKSRFKNKKAKIITSIAMFYDLEDPHAFVEDVKSILDTEGLWVIQMSYLPLMLQQLAFDNICHEHLEYYSLSSLKFLLDKHGLVIVDCQLNDINGGSFRIYIRKQEANPITFANAPWRDVARYRVASILSHEEKLKLKDVQTYKEFYFQIELLKKKTVSFIKKEKAKGKKIWAYGASTKGNTLLQWFGLDHTLIDGVAERQSTKYGLKTIGTNIPIYSESVMRDAKPDYALVLPWHFIEEFQRREQDFLKSGGKFIVPCPQFEILSYS
ncbi:MAG: hypothetical protein A2821_02955 [Candidatus Magasanikbacteria bacterium RIFCSPHIGHO2_01_FULL_41_23]|uniref:C-methyltransferase domain-containing protein n=1 Tax=Candidatus Magasanikbacteria bacterium RIFCSPLOWO2_01_FULL_40_15 TaxID=1798686 RepID=A0A1F6N3N4_9BACT|nr:MAG: hypothetical protein A2821_02955 [Candidatus Magasanikbacteria bacterium RIFCSPHIGHO2_01_FULL_41_23]OGH67297.1 MAG: hypothetical protein A3C66_00970 [Candidatus Magasanikbacteria bacterium RIFCSPHIGHO2_02_FULL_41_35]OGH76522.1 MAG: hypothetical protein A3F22_00180 [Candidatus Magasanikbacteria bacterium RIFCSPHIGHO2_12_FULL_41_16]OGH78492.1 MAG: hypothetical protein A2983_03175 [Candidatus Magasanikbacteria bacterium RIFCSPLOWO2_01_FULL_40_15]